MTNKQIEVEQKFVISERFLQFLKTDAEFIGSVQLVDEYFDNSNFELILSNRWLRRRNGEWELKLPSENFDPSVTSFNEISDLSLIGQALGLAETVDFENSLSDKGILPRIVINSKREKYKYKDFNIDLDETDFGYNLMEIEVLVGEDGKIADAKKQIHDFALSIDPGLRSHSIGKVRYYAVKFLPEIEAGIVKMGIYPPLSAEQYDLIRGVTN